MYVALVRLVARFEQDRQVTPTLDELELSHPHCRIIDCSRSSKRAQSPPLCRHAQRQCVEPENPGDEHEIHITARDRVEFVRELATCLLVTNSADLC